MGILSGLKQLGLDDLGDKKLFEEEKNTAKQIKKESVVQEVHKTQEKDFVYDKSYECPVCHRPFTAKTMKSSKARMTGMDQDLRVHYNGIDSVKYDVVLCPACGYAALTRYFTDITPGRAKIIKEQISPKAHITHYENEVYSYEEAIERYQLALANALVKKCKDSEKAYICLKSAWLMRGYAESLREEEAPDEALIAELESQELEYIDNAYEGFMKARQSENCPMCGMDSVTIDYLIAALALRLKHYDVAGRLIAGVLTAPNAKTHVKDKARDIKEQILVELKKR